MPAPPTAHANVPATWRALPDMARAIAAAAHVPDTDAQAWGEPARGCYAVWLAVPAQAGSDAIEADLHGVAGLAVQGVARPSPGEVTLAFARAPYHGRLRARAAAGRTEALACFWNAREPAACQAACDGILGGAR